MYINSRSFTLFAHVRIPTQYPIGMIVKIEGFNI